MKTPTIIGIILILIGIVALSIGGFSFTKKEKVVDLGPVDISANKKHSVALPPVLGIAALVGGVALVGFGAMSKKS